MKRLEHGTLLVSGPFAFPVYIAGGEPDAFELSPESPVIEKKNPFENGATYQEMAPHAPVHPKRGCSSHAHNTERESR